jgi:SAM-dependent methyltransferase
MPDEEIDIWEALYADDVPAVETASECDFIEDFLPLESHPSILDIACGAGRHSLELARRGYTVTGTDLDPRSLRVAARRASNEGLNARWIEADVRELKEIDMHYDGVIFIWQRFGFFDTHEQAVILAEIHRLLRPGGRLIFDLYNRLYFVPAAADSSGFEDPMPITDFSSPLPATQWHIEDAEPFLHHYTYAVDGRFVPDLYTPGEMAGVASSHGLHLLAACSNYNPGQAATRNYQRMQLVFGRG